MADISFIGAAFMAPIISSGTSRLASGILGFPLESYIARIQSTGKKGTVTFSGKRGFYTGFSTAIQSDLISACFFWVYYTNIYPKVSAIIGAQSIEARDSYAAVASAIIASVTSLFCSYPFEMVKTMKMIENDKYGHLGTLGTFKAVYSRNGILGFYSGI